MSVQIGHALNITTPTRSSLPTRCVLFFAFPQKLLAEQYQRALDLIRQHRNAIDALSEALLEKGVVHKADLEDMLGEKVRSDVWQAVVARRDETRLDESGRFLIRDDGCHDECGDGCDDGLLMMAVTMMMRCSDGCHGCRD